MPLKDQKIGFLGGGAMAEALITALLQSGLTEPGAIFVSNIRLARKEYLKQKFGVNLADNARCSISG